MGYYYGRRIQCLASKLNEVTKARTTDAEYSPGTTITGSNDADWTLANVTTATLPNNSYVFAMKYHAWSVTNSSTTKVKVSSDSYSDGYTDLGNPLPSHSGTKEDIYLVLKGSNTMTTDTGCFAIYKPEGSGIGINQSVLLNQGEFYFSFGDGYSGFTLLGSGNKTLYQGLSTTQKHW